MDRTEAVTRKLLAALPAPGYDLGVFAAERMQRFEALSATRLLRMLPYLKHRNASGAHIYLRPTGESAYTLLDDLTVTALARLAADGFIPAAAVETSPGSFQAWLRHTHPLPKELGTLAARMLAQRFGADPSAADWRRFGRAPGFTNRKPQHRNSRGLYPFARLLSSPGQIFPAAEAFRAELLTESRGLQQRATARRYVFATRPARLIAEVSLSRFRTARRYQGRPAAADMAFSICACAQGWSEAEVAEALRRDYLSRDTDRRRREAYIQRTLCKAMRWAA